MEGIHHIALRVNDCLAAARFYEQACGLQEIHRSEEAGEVRAVWLRCGESVLMLERSIRGVGPREGSGHVLVFATDNLDEAWKRLEKLGASITDRTASTLYFQDPDGHRLGLSIYRFNETAS